MADNNLAGYRPDPLPHSRPAATVQLVPLRWRAWWVAFGSALVAALSLIAMWAQAVAFVPLVLPPVPSWAYWMAGEEGFALTSAALVATTIIWLFWVYRAVANLKGISAPAMSFGPAAAVIWCLIPLVGLVMQYFVMRAIWQGTFRQSGSIVPPVALWAASAVAPAAAALVPVLLVGSIDGYDVRWEAIANLMQALSCGLTAALTLIITRGQGDLTDVADTFS
jgi:hypothetical protein